MIKKILVAIGLGILPWTAALAFDGPYFIGLYGPHLTNVQASLGAVIDGEGDLKSAAFTNVAVVYHEADPNNTLIPESLQAYVPPESWTLLNVGYGGGIAGLGSSVNLAATAQGYLSRGLLASSNLKAQVIGAAVKPSTSGLSINAGPQLFATIIRSSVILPFNQWKGIPGWFIGAAYTKKF